MKALCQPVDGICTQCHERVPENVRRRCDPDNPRPFKLSAGVAVGSTPRKAYLSDTIIRDGRESTVQTLRPNCKHLGGKKHLRDGSPLMAKQQGCLNTPENIRPIIFTPVYHCWEFSRCAPFAAKIEDEADPTHPCIGCQSYERKPPEPTEN